MNTAKLAALAIERGPSIANAAVAGTAVNLPLQLAAQASVPEPTLRSVSFHLALFLLGVLGQMVPLLVWYVRGRLRADLNRRGAPLSEPPAVESE